MNKQTLVAALEKGEIQSGDTVYVTGNMGKLGLPCLTNGTQIRRKTDVLKFYADTILDFLGNNGTIVFPTHSWGLVKSNETFVPNETTCDYLLSEYLRVTLNCNRQLHPFASVAAYGARAKEIISHKLTRHPYGPGTPFERLKSDRAMHLSIGLPIEQSFSAAHYCEFVCGVPYRYTKSFTKQIRLENGNEVSEEFFLYVCYLKPTLTRDRNKKAFEKGCIVPNEQKIGKGMIQTIQLDKTINRYIELLQDDPYIWLKEISGQSPDWPWFN